MKIAFIGQLGFPPLLEQEYSSPETRVEVLARLLAQSGHQVLVTGTAPYLRSGNYHGIHTRRISSLNPDQPGGWLHIWLSLRASKRFKADIIHIHALRAAISFVLLKWMFGDITSVWTIDFLPKNKVQAYSLKLAAKRLQDAVLTTPSRTLQYRLLNEYGVRTQYIPDGYNEPVLPPVPIQKQFQLRRNQYVIVLAASTSAVRWIAQAYKQSGSKKPLVVLQEEKGPWKRLKRQYKFLYFVGPSLGRLRRSLLANAATVVLGDATTTPVTLLRLMHDQRAVIAINEPVYQEVIGTTGLFVKNNDAETLKNMFSSVSKDRETQNTWGEKAHLRATNHFRWERILPEYISTYTTVKRLVPLDAAQPITFTQPV